jgi:hypothetical protein
MYVGARTGGGAGLTTSDLGDDDTDANIHALTMSNANLCFANIVLLFWHFFALLDEVVRFFAKAVCPHPLFSMPSAISIINSLQFCFYERSQTQESQVSRSRFVLPLSLITHAETDWDDYVKTPIRVSDTFFCYFLIFNLFIFE